MFGNLKERDKRLQQSPAPLWLTRSGRGEGEAGRSAVEVSIEKYEKAESCDGFSDILPAGFAGVAAAAEAE